MSYEDIKLPPLARPQVPLVEADVSLIDIKVLARWCERTATEYARAAVLADRASRAAQAPAADGDALREAAKIAYGYLWHVNTEPGTPNQYAPERAAYKARIVLREQLTKDDRGEGINVVRAAMQRESGGGV